MGAPVQTVNTLPATINVGGSADWVTRAVDPDAVTFTVTRPVTDSQGNTTTFTKTSTVSDPLTYGAPSCDNPNVRLVVDPADPAVVHVTVNSAP